MTSRAARLPAPAGELPRFTPVPRRSSRHDGWSAARQRSFIEALADTGSVTAACKAVGMSAVGAYQLRRQPGAESFRAAWEAALQLGVQRIEDVAMDRALNGVDLPVYSYGKLVGTRTSYNDRLLMFMLRSRAPDRFADGRAKALNALDLTRLEQERKKWRREWELEQRAARGNVSAQEVRASIDRKVEEIRVRVEAERQREWDALSDETRAAWERFQELKARDLAAMYPDRPEPAEPRPQYIEYAKPPAPKPPPEPWDRIRRLKDDGWE